MATSREDARPLQRCGWRADGRLRYPATYTTSWDATERYDPTKRAGAALSAEMRAIFDATRAHLLSELAGIGIAHRTVRLRRLQRLADKAESMGSIAMAAKLLEQAAREMGGTFTNKLAVSGDGQGGPVQHSIAIRFVSPKPTAAG